MYDWAVIGAGPAGIAAVGRLLDHRVDPKKLIWVDPEFKVGDFGTKWSAVPSNTSVGLFIRFLHHAKSFHYLEVHHDFQLSKLDLESTCLLSDMAEPLNWVTARLQQQVPILKAEVAQLSLSNQFWHFTAGSQVLSAKQVVLAVGSEPIMLQHPGVTVIPLAVAMRPTQLASACGAQDRIAVFGSSHSAVLAMRNLAEAGVKNIINFYRTPLRYAVPLKDWILYDDTGLKGVAAAWAHQYIDTGLLPGLVRYYSDDEHIARYLPECDKVIYAVGFERRRSLAVANDLIESHDPHTGIIAPGLFGFGIAYPEAYVTPFGSLTYRVGLWKFMEYLDRVLPVWLRYLP